MRSHVKILLVSLLATISLALPASAQEGGTPPVTVIPVPEPSQPSVTTVPETDGGSDVPAPAATAPADVEDGATEIESSAPSSSDQPAYIWLAAIGSAIIGSAVTALIIRRRQSDHTSAPEPNGRPRAPYELLAFAFEEERPGDLGLKVMSQGTFQALEHGIEAARSHPEFRSTAENGERVWWVLTEQQSGETAYVISPTHGRKNGNEGSMTRIERLLADLNRFLNESARSKR